MPDDIATRCSFCQRLAPEVNKLIAGPGLYICDRCVGACVEILEQAPPSPEEGEVQLPSWQSVSVRRFSADSPEPTPEETRRYHDQFFGR